MALEARAQDSDPDSGRAAPVSHPKTSLIQPLIAALLLTIVCLPLPFVSLENDADTSLVLLLDYARQHSLQFGVDFVNTYGPLGFLIFPYYSPDSTTLRLVADLFLALAATTGLCLVAWRQPLPWRALILTLFIWATANIRVGPDLLLNVMLLSWGLLCILEDQRRLTFCCVAAAALAGFCAVAKISFLVVAGGGTVLLAIAVWLKGRRHLALTMPAVFAGVFLVAWCGMGQDPANLPTFLVNALATIRGYNAALGVDVRPSLRHIGTGIVLLTALVVIVRTLMVFGFRTGSTPASPELPREGGAPLGDERATRGASLPGRWLTLPLVAWAFMFTFAAWKHGFVRTDSYHVSLFLGFIPVLLLSFEALPESRGRLMTWLRSATLIACFAALAALQYYCLQPFQVSLAAPWESAKLNLSRLLHPAEFRRQADARIEEHRRQAQLPRLREIVGNASVDVFGFRQSYALFNGLNFHPRPVSQSYAACNTDLMSINESFELSGKGADFFLFELSPLDSKFPVLEDAMVLRDLVLNFQPVASEDRFVLLKRVSLSKPRLHLLRETTVKPGELIDLEPYGNTNLWLEIDLAPSFWGHLRQFVSQPPVLRLAAWQASGNEDRRPKTEDQNEAGRTGSEERAKLIYRRQARASLLASGFVASPLLRWTRDILNLPESAIRPGAYTLELNGQDDFWANSAHVRVFEIQSGNTLSGKAVGEKSNTSTPDSSRRRLQSNEEVSSRPFTVFRNQRWRPDQPPPGGASETIAYALILLLPVALVSALVVFAKRVRRSGRSPGVARLLVGNALVFVFLASLAFAGTETYFRYFYDTTDSMGYTRVSERWVQRHWHVNSAGCRDNVEYSPALEPRKRRLTFVGDSFTAGHGIKQVDARFTNLLRKAHPDWQIHVLANVGLDTGAETVLVNKLAAKGYAFDQVVLVYCLNDIADLLPQQNEAFGRMFDSLASGNWLARNSYALNLWSQRYKAAKNPYVRDYFSFVREAYQGETWLRQKNRLREFRVAVESRGGKLAVVTFPFLDDVGPGYPYKSIHAKLEKFWSEEGVPHLDLLPVYANLQPRELVVNSHDAHPNELANRLAANAIDKFLFPPPKGAEAANPEVGPARRAGRVSY